MIIDLTLVADEEYDRSYQVAHKELNEYSQTDPIRETLVRGCAQAEFMRRMVPKVIARQQELGGGSLNDADFIVRRLDGTKGTWGFASKGLNTTVAHRDNFCASSYVIVLWSLLEFEQERAGRKQNENNI